MCVCVCVCVRARVAAMACRNAPSGGRASYRLCIHTCACTCGLRVWLARLLWLDAGVCPAEAPRALTCSDCGHRSDQAHWHTPPQSQVNRHRRRRPCERPGVPVSGTGYDTVCTNTCHTVMPLAVTRSGATTRRHWRWSGVDNYKLRVLVQPQGRSLLCATDDTHWRWHPCAAARASAS